MMWKLTDRLRTDGGLGGQEHMLLLLIPVEAEYFQLQQRTVNVCAGGS